MISKDDARKLWTSDDDAAFDRAETIIDRAIRSSNGGRILADLARIDVSLRVRARITKAYCDAGWTVKWTDGDQRDPGPFVDLE
jgi:late competence protein required for DNA uptake (superfamily II DNA/RNA helicase)